MNFKKLVLNLYSLYFFISPVGFYSICLKLLNSFLMLTTYCFYRKNAWKSSFLSLFDFVASYLSIYSACFIDKKESEERCLDEYSSSESVLLLSRVNYRVCHFFCIFRRQMFQKKTRYIYFRIRRNTVKSLS